MGNTESTQRDTEPGATRDSLRFHELVNGARLFGDGTFVVPGLLALPARQGLPSVCVDGGLTILSRRAPLAPLEVHQRCGLKHSFTFHPVEKGWEQVVERHNGSIFGLPHWQLSGCGAAGPLAFLPGGSCRVYGRTLRFGDAADDLSVFGRQATFEQGHLRICGPKTTLHFRYDTAFRTWLTKLGPAAH